MERASEKTEDTFINIPIYTESHNLSILGNNTQRQQEASVTGNQRQARPQQEQEEQTHSGGMRR